MTRCSTSTAKEGTFCVLQVEDGEEEDGAHGCEVYYYHRWDTIEPIVWPIVSIDHDPSDPRIVRRCYGDMAHLTICMVRVTTGQCGMRSRLSCAPAMCCYSTPASIPGGVYMPVCSGPCMFPPSLESISRADNISRISLFRG